MGTVNTSSSLNVAIVGGGIIGVITALGLLRRGIPVTIYERASDWHEIGAGFAFTGLARECMKRLDPRIVEELIGVSEEWSPTRFWDGFHPRTKQEAEQDETAMLWQIPQENLLYRACVRSHLLFRMTALLPEGVTVFGKQLVDYEDNDENDKVILNFADGSTAKADVVIGCDGIHSATREVLLGGGDHPVPRPTFTHMVAYRTMVPMAAAITVLGEKKARSTCMHCGPKANVMSYPVRIAQRNHKQKGKKKKHYEANTHVGHQWNISQHRHLHLRAREIPQPGQNDSARHTRRHRARPSGLGSTHNGDCETVRRGTSEVGELRHVGAAGADVRARPCLHRRRRRARQHSLPGRGRLHGRRGRACALRAA